VGLEGRAWLGERILLGAAWGLLRDETRDGAVALGAGDLQLGTVVEAVRLREVHLHVGWGVKLPNAADEGELGTDETDVSFGGSVGWSRGAWAVVGSVGLGVLGNPLKFANQDDVPLLRAEAAWRSGWCALRPMVAADFSTSRNPARVRAGGSVRFGRAVFVEASSVAGLTPAEADWQVGLGAGWRADLPGSGAGE
jgi:hypothetical protein